jgi:hypothetical protein
MDVGAAERFDRAIALSQEASAAGEHEAGYHALMAALHFATDLGDEGRLLRVAEEAAAQGRAVDSVTPHHRLSAHEAELRGHKGVYRLAERQAMAQAALARRRAEAGCEPPASR